jgi:hypothetical protein
MAYENITLFINNYNNVLNKKNKSLIIFLLFFMIIKILFIEFYTLIILFSINILISIYKKFLKQIPFEFELITISTIFFSQNNWKNGMVIGSIMLFSILLIERRFSPYNLIKLFGIFILSILSNHFFRGSFFVFITLIIFYNLFLIITYNILNMKLYYNLMHQTSNIIFNILIFSRFTNFITTIL